MELGKDEPTIDEPTNDKHSNCELRTANYELRITNYELYNPRKRKIHNLNFRSSNVRISKVQVLLF